MRKSGKTVFTRNPLRDFLKHRIVAFQLIRGNASGQFQARHQSTGRIANFGVVLPYHMKYHRIILGDHMVPVVELRRCLEMQLDISRQKGIPYPEFGLTKVGPTAGIGRSGMNHPQSNTIGDNKRHITQFLKTP